jgi:hypothetical protein
MLLVSICTYLKSVLRHTFNSGYSSSGHVIKGVRIHDYFSKPKGLREQKNFQKHWIRPWVSIFFFFLEKAHNRHYGLACGPHV